VKTFSGGMKRRLNLILGLLHDPEILLCDEPTVGVDPQSRNAIFEFLEEQNKNGLTIIYTTHYMEEAERLCSRIGIIDHGEIKAIGSRSELLKLTKERPLLLFPDLIAPPENLFNGLGDWQPFQNGFVFKPKEEVRVSQLFQLLESTDFNEDEIQVRQPSLEGVFLNLTGKELRD
jgi:ABC-2 type transport system ATP-binding protein